MLPKSGGLTGSSESDRKIQRELLQGYGNLPLSFEVNQGQTDGRVKFLSRGSGYTLFLTGDEAVFALCGTRPPQANSSANRSMRSAAALATDAVLQMKLLRANPAAKVSVAEELPGNSNYFVGNDPKKWHANVRQYGKVRYESVYPGVDLVYYGNQRELEYDFVLKPGADPAQIRLGIDGMRNLRLDQGDLVMSGSGGEIHLRRPHIYQEAHGSRREVRGGYVLKRKDEVGFQIDTYDHARTLVIDPVLAYSTFLGGTSNEIGYGIAVDSSGSAYVVGLTESTNFPQVNAFQSSNHGDDDVFVTKINPEGTAMVYSTYLGGHNRDRGYAIALDSAGNAYVTGETVSNDFPLFNPIQSGFGNFAFVTKINAQGSALVYSTFLGGQAGQAAGYAIAVDASGNAYLAGNTTQNDFPTVNAIQPTYGGNSDVFITKINAAGSAFVYSTYLGGSGLDGVGGISVDSAGNAYVSGYTDSSDFPTAQPIQPSLHGTEDAFVTKINAAGNAMVYSTYLGGSNIDLSYGMAVDSAGSVYLTGLTFSTDFPTVNPIQPTSDGGAFVTKINQTGATLVYSTYLGSGETKSIAVDSSGNAYITGRAWSGTIPVVDAIQAANGGVSDAFVIRINAAGNAIDYSTYLGGRRYEESWGIAVDSAGSAYIVGQTQSQNFPKTPLAFQQSKMGGATFYDGFVTKIASQVFLSVSPLKLGLGKSAVGSTSKAKKVVLTNTGAAALTIGRIYLGGANPGDFAETNTCGAGIAAGGTCTVSITFAPAATGLRKAVLAISDSDASSPQTVPLSGTGD